jgi:hypothetical protein
MLLDRRISRDAFALYAFYSSVADDESRSWWSLEGLARIFGTERQSIRRWRKELAAAGLIEIEHHADAGKPSTVWLTDPVAVYGVDRLQNFLNEASAAARGGMSPVIPPRITSDTPPPYHQ